MSFKDVLSKVSDFLFGVFSKIVGESLAKSLSVSLTDLAKDDVGKLAIDAVEYVQSNIPGAGSTEKRDAAKAKLIADAKAAGHDLASFGESFLNLLVELAVQYVKTQTA